VGTLILFALLQPAADARSEDTSPAHEPRCASHNPLRNAYFGDLHVHTAYSQDASTQGTRNRPADAYRFARGKPLGVQPYLKGKAQRTLRLERALDFAAVTDHAELLGEVHTCTTAGLPGYDSIPCWIYRNYPRVSFFMMNTKSSSANPTRFDFCGPDGVHCRNAALTPWRDIQAAAEGAYDRSSTCSFTSFVAYEWTGSVNTNNLHRNVIFANERVPEHPRSFFETPDPRALLDGLRGDCTEAGTGCDVIVIPHNSNISNGLMWKTTRDDGTPIDAADARLQAEFERVVEIMQHKGDSECSLADASSDELCAFEKLQYQNFSAQFMSWFAEPPHPGSFVRDALGRGLLEAERIGVNPFQFGLIASTDTHLGTPGMVDEVEHPGHGGAGAPAALEMPEGLTDNIEFNGGGLAGVWAEENSRESIFESLRRREVFATSGPRIHIRFFGGWDFADDLCSSGNWVETGYREGVPMGAELSGADASSEAPKFAVWALRDAGTANRPGTPLQRLQIIKGWTQDGATHEAVFEVAGNPNNGAGVNPQTCETHGRGAGSLCRVWRDPSFDPAQRAFYYARAVENPTCRWSAHACNAAGVDCSDPGSVPDEFVACCSEEHRPIIQERAWSSPIWYKPAANADGATP
jgi:hypothetical protein